MKISINFFSLIFLMSSFLHMVARAEDTFGSGQWTEPVPVTSVNSDFAEDWSPFLSFDGLTLYFARVRSDEFYYGRIFEATREAPAGEFTDVREVSGELNDSPGHVLSPWVSPDGLRMYYHNESGGRFELRISERASVDNPWPIGTGISELNVLGDRLQAPELTPDELTIFFNGYDVSGGKGGYDIWMATRADKNSTFGQVENLSEINTEANDQSPSVSHDGLTLFFNSDRNGKYQLFRAIRSSLNEPFNKIEHLLYFDTPGSTSHHPCLSSDGSEFYFMRQVEEDRSTRDIWISFALNNRTYYVDAFNGSDLNDGLSPNTAFATIQKGIDSAQDGDTVLVYPGLYTEAVNFKGKAITIAGIPDKTGAPVIEIPDNFAMSCFNGESEDSVLKNFIIENSFMAGFILGSSPTLQNLTVVNNIYGIKAYGNAHPDIRNCIFWNNLDIDISGCESLYSWVQGSVQDSLLKGLVGYWGFDEEEGDVVIDAVGNNNGLIYGGASRIEGISEKALQFDGVDDYVSVPYSDDFHLSVFTISAWIRPEKDLSTTGGIIVARGEDFNSDHASYIFDVHIANSTYGIGIRLMYEDDSDTECFYDTEVFPDVGSWTHLAASRSFDGKITIYRDADVLDQWNSSPAVATQAFQDLTFGARWMSSTVSGPYNIVEFFPGLIDEIRIYNRALSQDEIWSLASISELYFVDPNNGDYHLRSRRGRYWPEHDVWVLDGVTSPCIDRGDPNSDYSSEPSPNGGRINMGAYGGTPYASMSEAPCQNE